MDLSDNVGGDAERVGLEQVRARVLPDGRLSAADAARYLGRNPKTLANWRSTGIGPAWTRNGGRIFYRLSALRRWMEGNA